MIPQERLIAGVTDIDSLFRKAQPQWRKIKVLTIPDTSYSRDKVCFLLQFPETEGSRFSIVRAEHLTRWIDSLRRESTVTYALTFDDPHQNDLTTILAEYYRASRTIKEGNVVFDETPSNSDGTPLPVAPITRNGTHSIRGLFLDHIFPHLYAGKKLVMSPAPHSPLEYKVVQREAGQKAYQLV